MMTQLVIDIGNTFTKLGVFQQDELLFAGHYENPDNALFDNLLTKHQISKAIVSSVKKEVSGWLTALGNKMPVVNFTAGMAKGITNKYLTPATLGIDRIAAVAGAWQLYPRQSSLIIDGG
ncbi:MAG: type III pantothenate kinase, partial [Sphingobacteriales bacterium]